MILLSKIAQIDKLEAEFRDMYILGNARADTKSGKPTACIVQANLLSDPHLARKLAALSRHDIVICRLWRIVTSMKPLS